MTRDRVVLRRALARPAFHRRRHRRLGARRRRAAGRGRRPGRTGDASRPTPSWSWSTRSVGATATDEAMARVLRRSERRCSWSPTRSTTSGTRPTPRRCGPSGSASRSGVGAARPRFRRPARRGARCAAGDARRSSPRRRPGPRRVALVGKPNVGKSSLLNKLTGESRSVVDAVAGTTVDPVDSLVELDGEVWRFVDTAGLRRRVHQAKGMEFYASLRTQAAIEAAEVAIVLIDSSEPLTEQDQRVISMVDRVRPGAGHRAEQGRPGRRRPARARSNASWRATWSGSPGPSGSTSPRRPAGACTGWRRRCERRWTRWDRRIPTGRLNAWLGELIAGDAAAGARRQTAEGAVRHPGREPAADVRAVHHRIPGGRLPPVHRASAARGLRLHRLAGAGQRAGPGEARPEELTRPSVVTSVRHACSST